MKTDTKFFDNDDGSSLLERFKSTLRTTRYFDVLVGFFRSSGFGLLADALKKVEKIRILVGLETEKAIVDTAWDGADLFVETRLSHGELREQYSKQIQNEFETAPENQQIEDALSKFMDFIRTGRLEIRGHPARNIHAKVYISRYFEDDRDFGNVVTGSSNFTHAGLIAQREFNVQLKDDADVKFALERFEKLWNESVELTEEFINTATKKTWLNNSISPYELYLKFLYEYFKEDINITDDIFAKLPDDFHNLEYQRQAVIAARKILRTHNGVFLADVVGLGKTFIAAMLLQNLPGYKLVICPPVLKPYWEESLQNFHVYPCKVVSSGKLADLTDSAKYAYIVVDEAHRFRNEKTQSYELLKRICLGKKIILVSATPFNNKLDDLLAQIKLFQKGKDSTIPGVPNLETFFRQQTKAQENLSAANANHRMQAERIAAVVRDKVLKHIMIRRTRKEVSKYFGDDIIKNALSFPDVEDPKALDYVFDEELDSVFNRTILLLKNLVYARYSPLLYQKTKISQIEALSQKNIKGFIKSLLVKRLESSFFAFNLTVNRIIHSYEAFIDAFNNGKVYVGKQGDIGDILNSDDLEEIEDKLTIKGVDVYNANDFDKHFLNDLQQDLVVLKEIASIWKKINKDPKYDKFLTSIKTDDILRDERVLIFTESRETGEYIYKRLQKSLPGKAMMFSSKNALYNGQVKSSREARELIRRNFDPTHEEPREDFRILITTDVLAEGMNLHKAGRIINYDLPWNPTLVMQRLGRINRVGTEHKKLYIFNFFPTAQADAHLGLQANVTKKIIAFNSVLGNDNKILFEEEHPDPHGLFNKLSVIGEENGEDSELEYLLEIREVRDKNPRLFEKIKRLPLKARSAYAGSAASGELLIFFREGHLKRFVAVGEGVRELTFLEAAPLMRAAPDEKRVNLPPNYYVLLQRAKDFLKDETKLEMATPRTGVQNRKLLEAISFLQHLSALSDDEQEYLSLLYGAVYQSALAKMTIKHLADVCKKRHATPLELFNAIRAVISPKDMTALRSEEQEKTKRDRKPRQIVLCQYIAPANEELL